MSYYGTKFGWGVMFKKGLKYFVIFGVSAFVTQFADSPFAGLTLGGLLVMFVNWLKVYWGLKLP